MFSAGRQLRIASFAKRVVFLTDHKTNNLSGLNNFFLTQEAKPTKFYRKTKTPKGCAFRSVLSQLALPATFACPNRPSLSCEPSREVHIHIYGRKSKFDSSVRQAMGKSASDIHLVCSTALETVHLLSSGKGKELKSRTVNKKEMKTNG